MNLKNKNIFKEYDIRGKYPEEINKKICFEIGKAWAKILKQNEKEKISECFLKNRRKTVVARDMRKSSPELARAFCEGIISQGIGADYLGMASTPMLYWTTAKKEYAGGAIITASHNSSEFNGIKICLAGARPLNPQELLPGLQDGCGNRKFSAHQAGLSQKKSYIEDYVKFIKKYYEGGRQLKIAVDAAWAMASVEIPFILDGTNIDFIPLCFGPTENFSNKDINPSNKGALDDLSRCIKKYKADIGIAFDGDADRVLFMDEKGELIDPEIISVLLALNPSPRAAASWRGAGGEATPRAAASWRGAGGETRIILDSRSGRQSRDPLEKMGFEVIASRSGHSNIKEAMRKHEAAFGAETSGHYYFDIGGNTPIDNAMIAMLKILSVLSFSKYPISAIAKKYDNFFKSIELDFKAKNPDKIISFAETQYLASLPQKNIKPAVSHLDGLTMEFPPPAGGWRFNLRKSNTEDGMLRLNIEAESEELLREKITELKKIIAP